MGSVVIQDRLYQLVGLFKGRTERQRDRLVDPDESEEEEEARADGERDSSTVRVPVGAVQCDGDAQRSC